MNYKYIEDLNYNLTRYLYARDEVELSFVVSLLEKKDIMECYFWGFELYYSGYDISQLIWKIFYDFYFHYNSKLESIIYKKLTKWSENKDYKNIAYIIQNLFRSKISHVVFTLRQKILNENYKHKFKRTRGRPPTWLNKYEKKYIPLVTAISNSDYYNIAFYLYNLFDENITYDIFVEIIKYFSFDHDHGHYMSIDNFTNNHLNDDVKNYWELRKYNDDKHYLLSMIIHLMTHENTNSNYISVIPREKHLTFIKNFEAECIYPVYNTLNNKRIYKINSLIGSFKLIRHNFYHSNNTCLSFITNYWEKYAYNTPCWNKRFINFNAHISNSNNNIIFDNDDNQEKFYEKYGYELDEQTTEIQDKSIGYIHKISKTSWYKTLFDENNLNKFIITNDNDSLFIY
tara:strand:- start:2349 stop:3548 length:1200 start_codon:yes stop_codon:yes gene_type:complete